MKKWLGVIMVLALMVMPAVLFAQETFPPPRSHSGTIGGRNHEAWGLGVFDKVEVPSISAPSGDPPANTGWLYNKQVGGLSHLFFEDEAGTATDMNLAGATAFDDIGDPDAAGTIAMTTYQQILTSTKTDGDNFLFKGLGAFGDISIVRIEQSTGNATDGTVLEVISADTDVDALLVTANSINSIVVAGSGNVSITGGTGVIDYTDFDVSADGLIIIAPDSGGTGITVTPGAALTTGLDVSSTSITNAINIGAQKILGTTGVIDFTSFDVSGAGVVNAVNLVLSGDLTVSGVTSLGIFKQDSLVPASASPATITINGGTTGGVTIGSVSTGTITLGGAATLVNLPAATDLTLAGGQLSITDTATANVVTITNNTMTTNSALAIVANAVTSGKVISATADALDTGTILYLDSDAIPASTYYIQCYDGSANDFLVGPNGATTITGAASTDELTLTAGDIKVTAGDVRLSLGIITVDNTADEANYIKRNFAGIGTGPALTVEDTHASSTNVALQVTSSGTAGKGLTVTTAGTGNGTGISVVHSGDLPALVFTAPAARTGDVINITMANQLAQQAIDISGAWTGTINQGLIDLRTTGAITAGASLLRLDADTAAAPAGDGWVLNVDDDTTATPTQYAVLINSASNEAFHVASGKSLFAELATFTGGIATGATSTFTTSITPASAGASTIGTTALEWGHIYLTDSAIIYAQANQGNTLTSSGTGWTANLEFAAPTLKATATASLTLGASGVAGQAIFNGGTSGTITLTPTATAGTTVLTLPATTGTLAKLENTLGDFAATTSAQLYGKISDETGSGSGSPLLVFNQAPTIASPTITTPTSITRTEVDGSAALSLSAAQVSGTVIYNTGQIVGDVNHTLPAAAAGYHFSGFVGTTLAVTNYWRFTANTTPTPDDFMCLNGTCGKLYVSVDTPTMGNNINCWTGKVSSTGIKTGGALAIGSTKDKVANGAFEFDAAGQGYAETADAVGTELNAITTLQNKYGAQALDIGADGTIDPISCTNIATGFNTPGEAVSNLPAAAASHARIGYVTAMRTNVAGFVWGTTEFDDAETTDAFTSSTAYTPPYNWICVTDSGTWTTN